MEPGKSDRSFLETSREELYELVWAKPVIVVARDSGVSARTVVAHCKKYAVPRPPRGYWTKKDAGKNPLKVPLPPAGAKADLEAVKRSAGKLLALPTPEAVLHPLALELAAAVRAERVDPDGRVHARRASLPAVNVTKALAERTAVAFHAIIEHTEASGIFFRKSQVSHGSGFFRKGYDRLHLRIEEGFLEKVKTGSGGHHHAVWQQQSEQKVPSGFLTFSLSKDDWVYHDAKRWTEGGKSSLRKVLKRVVVEIRRHFTEARKRRAKEAIERERHRVESERLHREYLRDLAVRQQREREERHASLLMSVKKQRVENLSKATELWHRHRLTNEFLAACEGRWRDAQAGVLTIDQEQWLQWAREINSASCPFGAGYPDPIQDGAFDAENVPPGSPYPEARKFA